MDKDKFFLIGALRGMKNRTVLVGIANAPKQSYKHDIVRISLLEEKDGKGKAKNLLVMTPREAVFLGVNLIRASILADFKIDKKEKGFDWATNWEALFGEKKTMEKAEK